jgi:lipid-binding SYLF domain-containing protein
MLATRGARQFHDGGLVMRTFRLPTLGMILAGVLLPPAFVRAQTPEDTIVDAATDSLGAIMAIPANSIPHTLLAKAQGLVIIPGMLKGGFVVGVRYGRGVIVSRDEMGTWKAPLFVTITGASFGWQIGIQGTDLILVFTSRGGLQGLVHDKLTLGANISAAAGPVGRDAAAATDGYLQAEILSYSRSRGLFIGVALDGSVLSVDTRANAAYYQGPRYGQAAGPPGQPIPVPGSAARLLQQVARYTGTVVMVPQPGQAMAAPVRAVDPQGLRGQLANSSQRLAVIVDNTWRSYLALPAEVYAADRRPTTESLRASLARFDAVAANPQYQGLSQRAEFQNTWHLLQQYVAMQQTMAMPTLSLPPPPR